MTVINLRDAPKETLFDSTQPYRNDVELVTSVNPTEHLKIKEVSKENRHGLTVDTSIATEKEAFAEINLE
jgi:hypothetical protein